MLTSQVPWLQCFPSSVVHQDAIFSQMYGLRFLHTMGMGEYLLLLKEMERSQRLGRENLLFWGSVEEVLLT